ncbi:MAG: hypothetical protein JRE64_21415 [Deltaproteobacteria bacterium]|nr:hypothetical protein [Deltaproteobacteria bacterium]
MGEDGTPAGEELGPVLILAETVMERIAGQKTDLEKFGVGSNFGHLASKNSKKDRKKRKRLFIRLRKILKLRRRPWPSGRSSGEKHFLVWDLRTRSLLLKPLTLLRPFRTALTS